MVHMNINMRKCFKQIKKIHFLKSFYSVPTMCQGGLDGKQSKHNAHPPERYIVVEGLNDKCVVTNWDKYHEGKKWEEGL